MVIKLYRILFVVIGILIPIRHMYSDEIDNIFEFIDIHNTENIGEFKTITDYSCINHSENKLLIPGNDSLLINLYDKLDEISATGRGNISIFHIGGSHVQAGVFSNQLRKNFRELIGDYTSSKGVLFPFKTMKTNAPKNYTMTTTGNWNYARCTDHNPAFPLGIKGATLCTSDTIATISFELGSSDDELWQYNKLTILANNYSSNPLLVIENDTIEPSQIGDYSYSYNLINEYNSGEIIFSNSNNDLIHFRGIIPENSNSGIIYHEAGINGASVQAWLRCDMFEKELTHINPDIVIFGIGINDANVSPLKFDAQKFKSNYRNLINKFKNVNQNAVFIFITNNDCRLNIKGFRNKYNPNTPKVEQAFIELAKEYNGVVWNLFRVMGGPESSNEWVENQLMQPDYIHFKHEGYKLLGNLLYNAFFTDYRKLNQND